MFRLTTLLIVHIISYRAGGRLMEHEYRALGKLWSFEGQKKKLAPV